MTLVGSRGFGDLSAQVGATVAVFGPQVSAVEQLLQVLAIEAEHHQLGQRERMPQLDGVRELDGADNVRDERHHNQPRPRRGIAKARPLPLFPEPITDPDRLADLNIRRRDGPGVAYYAHTITGGLVGAVGASVVISAVAIWFVLVVPWLHRRSERRRTAGASRPLWTDHWCTRHALSGRNGRHVRPLGRRRS
jgi:hypothetical protein